MTWNMFAYLEDDGRLTTVGRYQYVKAHMFREPIVPVLVEEIELPDLIIEDPTHWGWMGLAYGSESYRHEADTEPQMIWPRYFQLEMCFPYGIKPEVDAGKGRVVGLRVTQAKGDAYTAS